MQWLYLSFHSLQLESSSNLSQDTEPVIIVDATSHEVVQLNTCAKSLGIRVGMGLAMSLSLSQTLKVLEYQPEIEQERLVELAERLYKLTADISLDPPNGLFLRIDNMLRLYKDMADYWLAITTSFADLALSFHYASAPSPRMAKVLAQAKKNVLYSNKKEALSVLRRLSIDHLHISTKQKDQLNRVGIKTVAGLLDIPLKQLAKRFDLPMFTYLGQLTGELHTKLSLFSPKLEYRRTLELMFEISNAEVLQHPIKKLLAELETYLKIRNKVAQALSFELCYRYKEFITMSVERGDGEYRASKWLTLIRLQLESIKLTEPVVSIRLICTQLVSQSARVNDLFNQQASSLEPQELFALLQAKLGKEQVFRMRHRHAIEPSKVTVLCPLNDNKNARDKSLAPKGVKKLGVKERTKESLQTPNSSTLIPVSNGTFWQPTALMDIRPSYLQARPSTLKEQVTILSGPERITSGWWEFNPVCRDYYVAENQQGKKLWVFRTPNQQWFVHGYFS